DEAIGVCACELLECALFEILQRRRCEIPRVTGVQRRAFQRLPNDVNSRTELILMRESAHNFEAAPEINGELFEWFPFILQIESVEVAVLAGVIDNAQGNIAGLVAIGIDRENQCRRSDGGMLRSYKESAAERLLIVEFVARVHRDHSP